MYGYFYNYVQCILLCIYIYTYFFFLLFAVLSPRSDISSSKLTYRVVAEIGDGILKRSPCWVSAKNGYLALVCTWLCVPKVDIVGFPLLALFLVCEVPVGLFKKGHHTTCYDWRGGGYAGSRHVGFLSIASGICSFGSNFTSLACFKHHLNKFNIPSYSIQGTNIFPKNGILKMIFPFPKVGYVNSLEGIPSIWKDATPTPFPWQDSMKSGQSRTSRATGNSRPGAATGTSKGPTVVGET